MTTHTEPGQGGPAARVSQYARGSVSNMARSLLVIVALVAALVALVPRSDQMTPPAVDAQSVVAHAVKESGSPFETPMGLGEGWTATSARYAVSTDGLRTWQAVWSTPSGGSVSLKQTMAATPGWLGVATNQAVAAGSVDLSGRSWERRDDARGQIHVVSVSPEGLTTVVSGTVVSGAGGLDEIGQFVAALRPAPAAG